jgi:hypothetical protein
MIPLELIPPDIARVEDIERYVDNMILDALGGEY